MARKQDGIQRITVGELFRFQWNRMKGDWRIPVLWVVELILAVILAGAIAIYLDPELNVVPFPWNIVAFGIILGVAAYLYGFTRPFRLSRRMAKQFK